MNCCLQGYYSRLALRDIGTFLRYMESEFNIKVGVQVDRRVGFSTNSKVAEMTVNTSSLTV